MSRILFNKSNKLKKTSKSGLIKLENIYKTYQMGEHQLHALDNVNLSIDYGESIAILGPSGSGKSTLMNILGCLDSPSSGLYFLDGHDVSNLTRNELAQVRNRKVGFIFQSFNLLDYCSALENVALPLVYRGISRADRLQQAKQVLVDVGLEDRMSHKPGQLSGGQKQRVAIARALVTDPEVILADEPTGNLDSQSGEEVMDIFSRLSGEGKTILVVTHDQSLARRMGRVIEIKDGKVI